MFYVIEKGDRLWALAKRFYGDGNAYRRIFEANREVIKDPDLIFVGQKVRIPKGGACPALSSRRPPFAGGYAWPRGARVAPQWGATPDPRQRPADQVAMAAFISAAYWSALSPTRRCRTLSGRRWMP